MYGASVIVPPLLLLPPMPVNALTLHCYISISLDASAKLFGGRLLVSALTVWQRRFFLTVSSVRGWFHLCPTLDVPSAGRRARPLSPLLRSRRRPATSAEVRPTLCRCRSRPSASAAPAAWSSPSPPFILSEEDCVFKNKNIHWQGTTHPPCVYFHFLVLALDVEEEASARVRGHRERAGLTSAPLLSRPWRGNAEIAPSLDVPVIVTETVIDVMLRNIHDRGK